MKIELNGKALIGVIALSTGLAFGDFVTLIDAKSAGGVIVEETIIDTTPVGTVAMWATSTPPKGWIEMNGQPTTGYPELQKIVGSNVPDFRGEFVRAWDNKAGIDTNRALLSKQSQEFKGIYISTHQNNGNTYTHDQQYYKNIGGVSNGHLGVPNFGGAWQNPSSGIKLGFGNEEVRPRNVSVMYIIKAELNEYQ